VSRKKKKEPKVSLYLNPEMDQIIAAAEKTAAGDGIDDGRPLYSSVGRDTWKPSGHLPNGQPTYSNVPTYPSGNVVGGNFKPSHHHYGDDLIFEIDNKAIYGGKVGDVDLTGFDLAIDLAGLPSDALQNFVRIAPPRYKELVSIVKMPEIIRLNWRDWSWPNVGLVFWKKLWDLLPPKTLICCQGGHGRTGTCAASLMIASEHWTAADAIVWVRTYYWEDAIEGKGQEGYLADLEGGLYDEEPQTLTTIKE